VAWTKSPKVSNANTKWENVLRTFQKPPPIIANEKSILEEGTEDSEKVEKKSENWDIFDKGQ